MRAAFEQAVIEDLEKMERENTILREALERIAFDPDLACNWLSQEEAREALEQTEGL